MAASGIVPGLAFFEERRVAASLDRDEALARGARDERGAPCSIDA